eukprot:CAMPEP_0182798524 /NCGR_PEP_ID=MMETSP0006_2-20121128/1393_1 /TAXON_ID=97485 /ORGANISM="Prymnesium parvum, Strain Texoma1" /LENGTH=111 /DNA_ID=CAMNT_0024923641 /DNA_START=198 /DNA_END=532 /DNA_ORIENTATION=-
MNPAGPAKGWRGGMELRIGREQPGSTPELVSPEPSTGRGVVERQVVEPPSKHAVGVLKQPDDARKGREIRRPIHRAREEVCDADGVQNRIDQGRQKGESHRSAPGGKECEE